MVVESMTKRTEVGLSHLGIQVLEDFIRTILLEVRNILM